MHYNFSYNPLILALKAYHTVYHSLSFFSDVLHHRTSSKYYTPERNDPDWYSVIYDQFDRQRKQNELTGKCKFYILSKKENRVVEKQEAGKLETDGLVNLFVMLLSEHQSGRDAMYNECHKKRFPSDMLQIYRTITKKI